MTFRSINLGVDLPSVSLCEVRALDTRVAVGDATGDVGRVVSTDSDVDSDVERGEVTVEDVFRIGEVVLTALLATKVVDSTDEEEVCDVEVTV